MTERDESETIEVVIEDPTGSTERHHYDPDRDTWISRPHHATSQPWPANYGYIEGTWNATDDDELDVIVLSVEPIGTGSRISARPVGVLERPDGDHKILAVPLHDPAFGEARMLTDISYEAIHRIDTWFRLWDDPGEWHNELAAWTMITQAQARANAERRR